MYSVESKISVKPSLRRVNGKKWPRHKTTEQPSVSTHNILLPEQELRRREGCNFQCGVLPGRKKLVFFYTRETGLAAKIYPGYQVSIDHIKVCGGVV